MIDRPDHTRQPPDPQPQDSRAEQVLSQALRAMVGGDKPPENPGGTTARAGGAPIGSGSRRRLTTGQLLLLAAIVGLLVGIAVGLLSLLL